MNITPILPSEITLLRELAIRTYDSAFRHLNQEGVIETYFETAFAKANLASQLANPNSYWYFARVDNEIIAYIKLNTVTAQTEYKDAHGLEIERIYIDVPYLGKGYGGELVKFAISKARELEKNYIWLGVWEENSGAIKFYKKHGFKIIGTHDYDMIAEIQTDFIMRLDL